MKREEAYVFIGLWCPWSVLVEATVPVPHRLYAYIIGWIAFVCLAQTVERIIRRLDGEQL